jgi:hypothetical protein
VTAATASERTACALTQPETRARLGEARHDRREPMIGGEALDRDAQDLALADADRVKLRLEVHEGIGWDDRRQSAELGLARPPLTTAAGVVLLYCFSAWTPREATGSVI